MVDVTIMILTYDTIQYDTNKCCSALPTLLKINTHYNVYTMHTQCLYTQAVTTTK